MECSLRGPAQFASAVMSDLLAGFQRNGGTGGGSTSKPRGSVYVKSGDSKPVTGSERQEDCYSSTP